MISPNDAERMVFEAMPAWPAEECLLEQAQGRVLRAEVRADRDMPPYDRATLDGFAFRSASVAAGNRIFRIEGVQAAGAPPRALGPRADACVEIMTGAVVPEGADCVIGYEDVAREGATIRLADTVGELVAGNAVHPRGSDQRAGDRILQPGTRLSGREIAVAAACGYPRLPVTRLPRIAVVATGDELVDIGGIPQIQQIRRSNDYALQAALAAAGYAATDRFHWRDAPEEIRRGLKHALENYDALVFTGGVSKGKFDHLPAEFERQGVRKVFHGVAQRPGKPFWFGVGPGGVPVFALPGNPVSTYVCFHRYVLPALARASGLAAERHRTVVLAVPVPSLGKLACFMPVRLIDQPRVERVAEPVPGNTSGDFAGLIGTDGFVELPASQTDFAAGTLARYIPWS